MTSVRIVVLDGYTLNPGDLSWSALEALGEVTCYDRTPPEEVVARAQDAQIVLTNKVPMTRDMMEQLPKLRYIGVMATGYNIVDVAAAAERGIPVTNVPAYSTDSVAQFTFALLLELCHRVGAHSDAVTDGAWGRARDFSFTLTPQMELAGKRLGIVGYGNIGRRVARLGSAFGMEVVVTSRTRKAIPAGEPGEWTDLNTLLASSDVISLHCPLTPQTEGLIRAETLAMMKPQAFLINTARGGLVVEQDLAAALNDGRIGGAALDVLAQEPPVDGSPLIGAKNCIITPHMAWASKEARSRLMHVVVDNVRAFLAGSATNVVS